MAGVSWPSKHAHVKTWLSRDSQCVCVLLSYLVDSNLGQISPGVFSEVSRKKLTTSDVKKNIQSAGHQIIIIDNLSTSPTTGRRLATHIQQRHSTVGWSRLSIFPWNSSVGIGVHLFLIRIVFRLYGYIYIYVWIVFGTPTSFSCSLRS